MLFLNSPLVITSHGLAARFLDSAHGHAGMFCLKHDHDALWVKNTFQGICDLNSQSFLNLRSSCIDIYGTCELAETGYLAIRNIGNMCFAVKWHQMMLTHGIESDVFFENHFIVFYLKLFQTDADQLLRPDRRRFRCTYVRFGLGVSLSPSRSGSSPIPSRRRRIACSTFALSTIKKTTSLNINKNLRYHGDCPFFCRGITVIYKSKKISPIVIERMSTIPFTI